MGKKYKVNFYIDGFNIYHKIKEYQNKTGKCYKWLNYRKLFESLLNNDEEIKEIYFFTALAKGFGKDAVNNINNYTIVCIKNIT